MEELRVVELDFSVKSRGGYSDRGGVRGRGGGMGGVRVDDGLSDDILDTSEVSHEDYCGDDFQSDCGDQSIFSCS